MTKKVCENCKMFVKGDKCPNCGSTSFSDSYRGRIVVIDPEKSEIAKNLNIKVKGEFALKTR